MRHHPRTLSDLSLRLEREEKVYLFAISCLFMLKIKCESIVNIGLRGMVGVTFKKFNEYAYHYNPSQLWPSKPHNPRVY